MAEDASLNDFLSDGDAETDGSASDGETLPEDDTTAAEPESAATEGTTRATTTYAWDGDGAACASCGEVVERRWQQNGALICSACKDWNE
jgi:hypothetical protein